MLNPRSPLAVNGLNDNSAAGYKDQAFEYVYDVVLTSNQLLTGQPVSIYTTSDFLWRALLVTTFTGTFNVRFTDGQGYYLSNAFMRSTNILSTPADPFIMFPEVPYPAGGRILIDIQDTSAAGNTIQLVFRGAARYRI